MTKFAHQSDNEFEVQLQRLLAVLGEAAAHKREVDYRASLDDLVEVLKVAVEKLSVEADAGALPRFLSHGEDYWFYQVLKNVARSPLELESRELARPGFEALFKILRFCQRCGYRPAFDASCSVLESSIELLLQKIEGSRDVRHLAEWLQLRISEYLTLYIGPARIQKNFSEANASYFWKRFVAIISEVGKNAIQNNKAADFQWAVHVVASFSSEYDDIDSREERLEFDSFLLKVRTGWLAWSLLLEKENLEAIAPSVVLDAVRFDFSFEVFWHALLRMDKDSPLRWMWWELDVRELRKAFSPVIDSLLTKSLFVFLSKSASAHVPVDLPIESWNEPIVLQREGHFVSVIDSIIEDQGVAGAMSDREANRLRSLRQAIVRGAERQEELRREWVARQPINRSTLTETRRRIEKSWTESSNITAYFRTIGALRIDDKTHVKESFGIRRYEPRDIYIEEADVGAPDWGNMLGRSLAVGAEALLANHLRRVGTTKHIRISQLKEVIESLAELPAAAVFVPSHYKLRIELKLEDLPVPAHWVPEHVVGGSVIAISSQSPGSIVHFSDFGGEVKEGDNWEKLCNGLVFHSLHEIDADEAEQIANETNEKRERAGEESRVSGAEIREKVLIKCLEKFKYVPPATPASVYVFAIEDLAKGVNQ